MTSLRLGTRASKLALIQSRAVAAMLEQANPGSTIELVEVSTDGDRDQSSALATGTGWFTKAIQQALLEGRVDLAVHSYKDLPTRQPPGLIIAAVPGREDPRDAFISRGGIPLADLPKGSVVGTSSPRREAQLRALRPDVEIRLIRGNVDTRLAKVDAGEYDATVLALAGLRRMGLEHRATRVFTVDEMLPAPAQGALAVECREDDIRTRAAAAAIDQPALRPVIAAERAFMAALEAGCSFPAGAHAVLSGAGLRLEAMVAGNAGITRDAIQGIPAEAANLGTELAKRLLRMAGIPPA
jgi:hydroxymethylbilane synthase